jgi:hypothetical protein
MFMQLSGNFQTKYKQFLCRYQAVFTPGIGNVHGDIGGVLTLGYAHEGIRQCLNQV